MWKKNTINKSSVKPARETRKEKAAKSSARKRAPKPALQTPARANAAPRKLKKIADSKSSGRRAAAKTGREAAAKKAPAAGRKGAREKPARTRPDRTPRITWRLSSRTIMLILLLVLFVALSASPVARNVEATGKLKAMERELTKQQKTTTALEMEIDEARSPAYIDEEARRQRMVAPGEVLYLVTTDSGEPTVEYRLKALQSMDEAWEMIRKVLHCNAPRQAN